MSTTQASAPHANAWRLFLVKLRSAFFWMGLPLIGLIVIPIVMVLLRDGLP